MMHVQQFLDQLVITDAQSRILHEMVEVEIAETEMTEMTEIEDEVDELEVDEADDEDELFLLLVNLFVEMVL